MWPWPLGVVRADRNIYRFNHNRIDGTTGNYNMGFRNYDAGLNRFLTRDMYNGALAGGNPLTNIELDGHDAGSWCATEQCAAAGDNSPGLSGYGSGDSGSGSGSGTTDTTVGGGSNPQDQKLLGQYNKAIDDVQATQGWPVRDILADDLLAGDVQGAGVLVRSEVDKRFCEQVGSQ